MDPIIIYGGTFDPPHVGHLQTALAVQRHFGVKHFIFLPCKAPLLKQNTSTSAEQRLTMLKLALMDYPFFEIDTREITRDTPSYMVETLQSFREELGLTTGINLCLGWDAFLELPKWHQWENILKLSNIIVMHRFLSSHNPIPIPLQDQLATQEVSDMKTFLSFPQGKIIHFDAGEYHISSSELRRLVRAGCTIKPYLSPSVYDYIKAEHLYSKP